MGLESPDQFWQCLESRRPVDRQPATQTVSPTIDRLPAGLVVSLTKVVGLEEATVLAMTVAQAQARWQDFLRELDDPQPDA